MTAQRPLPRSLAPHRDESLAGYLLNLAARLRTTPAQAAYRSGLLAREKDPSPRIPAFYGDRLPSDLATSLAQACRITGSEAEQLTLARWDEVILTSEDEDGQPVPRSARSWLPSARTSACPACLPRADGPVGTDDGPAYATWRLQWRTPWSFACTRHGVLLIDRCAACATPLGLSGADAAAVHRSGLIASMSTAGLHPASCRARVPAGADAGRPGALRACGQRVDRQPLGPAADPAVLAAQANIDALFSGRPVPVTSLGATVSRAQYLRDLRLVAFALQAAGPDEWPIEPPAHTLGAIERASEERLRSVGTSRREASRWRMWADTPQETAYAAALLTTAMRIVANEDAAAARPAVQPLVAAASRGEPRLWTRVRAAGMPSRRLAHLTSPGFGGLISVNKLVQAGAVVPPGVHSGHVPQIAPLEADALIAPLAPSATARERRRATSLALVRLIDDCGLPEAAVTLGILPVGRATGNVAHVGKALRDGGYDDAFRAILVGIVAGLRPDGPDWRQRRQSLGKMALSDEDWDGLLVDLRRAQTRPAPENDLRRASWSLLIWAEVVGGDMLLSPHLDGATPEQRKEVLADCRAARRPAWSADVLAKWSAEFARRADAESASRAAAHLS